MKNRPPISEKEKKQLDKTLSKLNKDKFCIRQSKINNTDRKN